MKRGRRSAADVSVVPIDCRQRPQPPETLSEAERQEWQAIVNGFRADWFQGCEFLLVEYVRTITLSNWLWEMLAVTDQESKRFAELVQLRCAVTGALVRLATSLRMTPQSSRDSRNAKHVPTGPKPWDIGGSSPSDPEPFKGWQ
jgi:hypothetical protein